MIHNHEVPGSIPGPATKKSIEIETVRRLPLLAVFFIKTRWEHNGNTLYIMYSPLRKEYIQDLHYNFSTSSLDKPVAPIINSVGEPTCFK